MIYVIHTFFTTTTKKQVVIAFIERYLCNHLVKATATWVLVATGKSYDLVGILLWKLDLNAGVSEKLIQLMF